MALLFITTVSILLPFLLLLLFLPFPLQLLTHQMHMIIIIIIIITTTTIVVVIVVISGNRSFPALYQ